MFRLFCLFFPALFSKSQDSHVVVAIQLHNIINRYEWINKYFVNCKALRLLNMQVTLFCAVDLAAVLSLCNGFSDWKKQLVANGWINLNGWIWKFVSHEQVYQLRINYVKTLGIYREWGHIISAFTFRMGCSRVALLKILQS